MKTAGRRPDWTKSAPHVDEVLRCLPQMSFTADDVTGRPRTARFDLIATAGLSQKATICELRSVPNACTSVAEPDPDRRGAVLKGLGQARHLTLARGRVIQAFGIFDLADSRPQSFFHPPSGG